MELGGVMFWRGVAFSTAALILAGCVTERSGADYAGMLQKVGPPRAGQARIVVLREKAYGGIVDAGWDVKLDGGPMSDLKTGTYVYADRPAGKHQISATASLFPGVSQQDISAQAGRTYFFLARPSERAKVLNGMSAAGGVAGLLVGAAVTSGNSNPGPLDFFPLEDEAARATIAELRRNSALRCQIGIMGATEGRCRPGDLQP
jgi:hypothetical protein